MLLTLFVSRVSPEVSRVVDVTVEENQTTLQGTKEVHFETVRGWNIPGRQI